MRELREGRGDDKGAGQGFISQFSGIRAHFARTHENDAGGLYAGLFGEALADDLLQGQRVLRVREDAAVVERDAQFRVLAVEIMLKNKSFLPLSPINSVVSEKSMDGVERKERGPQRNSLLKCGTLY